MEKWMGCGESGIFSLNVKVDGRDLLGSPLAAVLLGTECATDEEWEASVVLGDAADGQRGHPARPISHLKWCAAECCSDPFVKTWGYALLRIQPFCRGQIFFFLYAKDKTLCWWRNKTVFIAFTHSEGRKSGLLEWSRCLPQGLRLIRAEVSITSVFKVKFCFPVEETEPSDCRLFVHFSFIFPSLPSCWVFLQH